MDHTSNCAYLIKLWWQCANHSRHTVYAMSHCNVTFEWYHGAHFSTNVCTQITYTNPNSNTKEKRPGWTYTSATQSHFSCTRCSHARACVSTRVRCTAVDKTCEASQEVSGSQSPAARCSVPAPQSCWASISHGCAQSSSQRTMRLISVSTLLLFFSSSGTVPRLLFLASSLDFKCFFRLSRQSKTSRAAYYWRCGVRTWEREVLIVGPCLTGRRDAHSLDMRANPPLSFFLFCILFCFGLLIMMIRNWFFGMDIDLNKRVPSTYSLYIFFNREI